MARLPTSLLLVCALALPAAAAAAPSPDGTPLKFDVTVGPNNDIKCVVDATLYTPTGASKAHPVPAILATNGFGGSKADFVALGKSYAKRGYAFLAYSGLGFGGSGCKIYLDDRDYDGKAGSQLVSFLGGTKAAQDGTKVDYVIHDTEDHYGVERKDDPRVGMTGGSYGGQIQFAIAGIDPRVDTLQPQITWNDLSYSLGANNTDFVSGVTYNTPGVTKLDWPVLFFGLGVGDGLSEAFQNQDTSHIDGQCPNFNDQVCLSLVQSGVRGYADPATLALLRHASAYQFLNKINIPVFLRQGEHDSLFNLQEATATYKTLLAQKTPVKMLWRSNGHSGGGIGAKESDDTNLEGSYESRAELEWFDYYLTRTGDAPKLDFEFLRDWALPATGDGAPAVGSTPSYPASENHTYYLSGTNKLANSPSGAASAVMANVPGSATGQGGSATESVPTFDPPGQNVAFSSDPLAADTDVVGIPSVTLTVDAPAVAAAQSVDPLTHLVLFAKLYDVDSSGTATLPANLLSAARVADVGGPVTIELPGIAHRFAKGHTLRLTLATANATGRNSAVAGPVTITGGTLTVPQLGTQRGASGAGTGGTTQFTPAKGAPAPIPAGSGAPPATGGAPIALPSNRGCGSLRRFTIRLPKAHKGDRVISSLVMLNGHKLKVRKGKVVVDLRKLPRGTYRVSVTVRFKKAATKRAARTYHTCRPGHR